MKTNCPSQSGNTDNNSQKRQKPTVSPRSNRQEDNSANDFIGHPSDAENDFLDSKGYGEYRQQLAEQDQYSQERGNLPLADQIHHALYQRLRDADGILPKEKAGDVAIQHMPRADNYNVQGNVAASIAHRIIKNDPHLDMDKTHLTLSLDAPDLPMDIKAMRLPKPFPQNSTFSTTNKNIVDNQGNTLPGLVHNTLDNSYATQASRLMSKEAYKTPFDSDDSVSYMEQQNKIQEASDQWEDAFDVAGLILKKQLDEGVKETQAKTRVESLDKVREVFDTIPKGQAMYFQIFHDWRARYYFKTRFFNPQGTSFEKASVALTWEQNPVFDQEMMDEFAIHMANLAGKDKGQYANYPERKKWFYDNIHTADDILIHFDEADWPEAMTHWDMHLDGQAGNIPIARDSTTSGYQMVAALMGDQEGLGSLTNINGEPTKNDLYTTAAQEVIDRLGIKEEAGSLRKVFKKPTMMVIYNAGAESIGWDIVNNYIELKAKQAFPDRPPSPTVLEKWAKDSDVDAIGEKMAHSFLDIMGMGSGKADKRFSTATKFKTLLQDAYMAGPTSETTWTFPDGQDITFNPINKNAYKERKVKGDSRDLYGSDQRSIIDGEGYTYKPRTFRRVDKPKKNAPRALMANFVQSVDAYLANYVTVEMIKEGYPILVVHDSYATTAVAVERMQQLYLKGISTLTTRDSTGKNFLEKAIHDISGDKKSFNSKDIDLGRLAGSIYALS